MHVRSRVIIKMLIEFIKHNVLLTTPSGSRAVLLI